MMRAHKQHVTIVRKSESSGAWQKEEKKAETKRRKKIYSKIQLKGRIEWRRSGQVVITTL